MIVIEGIACSAEDAQIGEAAGLHRLEVCSAVSLGGLTPSVGLLRSIQAHTSLELMAMLRPRQGGFCYSDLEFDATLRDAEELLGANADGIVFGILTEGREVDVLRCRQLVDQAGTKQTVFHRAFDAVLDPFEALEELVDLGVTRVLTSGQEATALAGSELICRLIECADGRIEIMAGGGIRPENVRDVLRLTGATQIHLGPFVPQSDRSVAGSDLASSTFGTTYPVADGDTLSRLVATLGDNEMRVNDGAAMKMRRRRSKR